MAGGDSDIGVTEGGGIDDLVVIGLGEVIIIECWIRCISGIRGRGVGAEGREGQSLKDWMIRKKRAKTTAETHTHVDRG